MTARGRTPPLAQSIFTTLSGALVDDLAGLEGGSLEDPRIAFQVMPWADRAVLDALGVIDIKRGGRSAGRVKRVDPVAVELVALAHKARAERNDL